MRPSVSLGFQLTPAIKRLLIACAVIWLAEVLLKQWLASSWAFAGVVVDNLALVPSDVFPGLEFWQIFTYMWLHDPSSVGHVFWNCLFLWMFGGQLEADWGARAFMRFYLICGVGAGLVVFLAGKVVGSDLPTLGSSGAVYGLIVAWVINYPNRIVYFFGLFPIKGKYFALFPIVVALTDFLVKAQGVSHAAHLGGMAIGALLVTGYWRPRKLAQKLRVFWLRRRLKVLEGERADRGPPPGSSYWH